MHVVRGGAQPHLIPEDSVNYRSAAVGFRIVLEEGGRRM